MALVGRGPYQTGIRRRREIIDAASLVFARYGYTGGSLRQIANDVGVTPAALTRHFGNKEGLLQAVIEHWENENICFFDQAHGLEYFRRLPDFIRQHTKEPGLIELLLTLATEATNPQHPARKWAVARYKRTVDLGVKYLREACAMGEVLPMDDSQMESESRALYSLMDGIQLQWLLDPRVNAAEIFRDHLETFISRWSGAVPASSAVATHKKPLRPTRARPRRAVAAGKARPKP
jgi:AcrR family transcriptional regulator